MTRNRPERPWFALLATGVATLFLLCGLGLWLGRETQTTGYWLEKSSHDRIFLVGTAAWEMQLTQQANQYYKDHQEYSFGRRNASACANFTVSEAGASSHLCFTALLAESGSEDLAAAVAFLDSIEPVETLIANGARLGAPVVSGEAGMQVTGNPLNAIRIYAADQLQAEVCPVRPGMSRLSPVCFQAGLILLVCSLCLAAGREFVALWSDASQLIADFIQRLTQKWGLADTTPDPLTPHVLAPIPIPVDRKLTDLASIRLRR